MIKASLLNFLPWMPATESYAFQSDRSVPCLRADLPHGEPYPLFGAQQANEHSLRDTTCIRLADSLPFPPRGPGAPPPSRPRK
jgi:hypothetical protein